ncbi:DUF4173 domain-containing protein [Hymenobacter lutimineralis]|uniref:DUF4173 domain-containing protein n=1 Tax=Hymenobacter lutimineralis TaxID=2606448 RepID=A0A5D6UWI6_9BACT|nr:DUF4173 domain-containing protein [Hymenobacter lutimineralis]TYZ06759.1 DUF4173 domain-containing protein [Hymenobacter lutimineralis]
MYPTSLLNSAATPNEAAASKLALTTLQKLAMPVGALLFDLLFWQERAGLNMLLYTVVVVLATAAGRPHYAPQWRSGYAWLLLLGTLGSAVLVAWYGSGAAILACWVSLAGWLGYLNQPHLRLVSNALLTALVNAAHVLMALPMLVRMPTNVSGQLGRFWFYARLLVVPLITLFLFHVLFVVANPQYEALSERALAALSEWLVALFSRFSLAHVLFFVAGLALTAAVLLFVPVHYFADRESRFGEFVQRKRDQVASFSVRRPDFRRQERGSLDLRKEFLVAAGLLGLVNVLLLVVNIIDVNWIWFGFVREPGFDLTQFVHEGTYVLIFSILVAMSILLWFFRRNLNFYRPGLPLLRVLATVWVLQNAVLAVSVGLRNYYYILYTGLAYKRLGVCFFLLLVLFGLGTLLLKIWQRRSAFSLVRLNSLAAYAVLLLLAAGNWEVWIARYNLRPALRNVDYGFLLAMPDRVLPTLVAHEGELGQHQLQHEIYDGTHQFLSEADARTRLHKRLRQFRAQQQQRHWPSYTWADWQAYQAL